MRTQTLNRFKIEWSPWYGDGISSNKLSHLHNWDGCCHLEHHKAIVCRYTSKGKALYEVSVNGGAYGETGYVFADGILSAKEARLIVETDVERALNNGDLYF